ncbi:MAG TPA: sterol desaturase family protein, partial [Burkholderiaceae bacterium]
MRDAQVIVLATPVFFLLIAIELAVAWLRGVAAYAWPDTLSSIGLGMLSQLVGLFTKLFTLGLYTWAYEHARLATLDASSPAVWLAALLAYDFCYYWLHRAGHRVALLWAAHVVHHQSEEYNLSTALRQTGSGWLAGWLFYLPLAVAGVPPLVFAVVALVDLLYQFWVHTRLVGSLGWFDRVFCAPSNHRVHHAVNDVYLDRNFGGILVVWDRWFGTFQPELPAEPCVYGTRSPLRSWNPLWANVEVYAVLAHDSRHARSLADKLRLWFKPPGWRPADV